MKLYKTGVDHCSGSKFIAILGNDKRALFGLYPGYISVFYRTFPIRYELVNTERLGDVLNTCDIETLTQAKLKAFLEEPLPFWQRIYYNYINRETINFIKYRESKYRLWQKDKYIDPTFKNTKFD